MYMAMYICDIKQGELIVAWWRHMVSMNGVDIGSDNGLLPDQH